MITYAKMPLQQRRTQIKDDTASYIRFQKLLSQNPDCAGWITLPNSNVDYPVVFGASTDENKYGNSYYLDHLLMVHTI